MTERHGNGGGDAEKDDELLGRVVESLRELPPVDRDKVARIVATAARARELDIEPNADDLLPLARPRVIRWPTVAAIAAAAAIVGFFAGSGKRDATGVQPTEAVVASEAVSAPPGARSATPPPPSTTPTVGPVSAAATSAEALPIPTQFVFDARGAKRVVLVGDFNGWDEQAAPLEREAASSLWSTTVPLVPGRHVYAFLVDSVWTTDPRAPTARDPDFGVTGSVIIVGKP